MFASTCTAAIATVVNLCGAVWQGDSNQSSRASICRGCHSVVRPDLQQLLYALFKTLLRLRSGRTCTWAGVVLCGFDRWCVFAECRRTPVRPGLCIQLSQSGFNGMV